MLGLWPLTENLFSSEFCIHCLKLNDTKFCVVTDESTWKIIGIKDVITKTCYLSNHDNEGSM